MDTFSLLLRQYPDCTARQLGGMADRMDRSRKSKKDSANALAQSGTLDNFNINVLAERPVIESGQERKQAKDRHSLLGPFKKYKYEHTDTTILDPFDMFCGFSCKHNDYNILEWNKVHNVFWGLKEIGRALAVSASNLVTVRALI